MTSHHSRFPSDPQLLFGGWVSFTATLSLHACEWWHSSAHTSDKKRNLSPSVFFWHFGEGVSFTVFQILLIFFCLCPKSETFYTVALFKSHHYTHYLPYLKFLITLYFFRNSNIRTLSKPLLCLSCNYSKPFKTTLYTELRSA